MFAFTLFNHVRFPLLSTLLHPLFHEAGVALKLINLNSAHLLLAKHVSLAIIGVETSGVASLTVLLVYEALKVIFKVDFLLCAIELSKTLLEKLVSDIVVFGLASDDFLGGQVVAKLTSFSNN